MSLYTPLKSGSAQATAPDAPAEAPEPSVSTTLLFQIRRNEAALAALRDLKHGPHPDERIIQGNITRLRDQLMHPEG
ncbi:hypothetical protein [Tropicibacter sp. S64]|uniref:hypothetical protein n=1 Tax=Tropicibacter sp. S64 TaxID=3415122 RepID=UPI003C7CCDCB